MDKRFMGICYFGEVIARIVDQGATESIETLAEKASNKELMSYLIKKYTLDYPSHLYNMAFLEEYFSENLLESRKSGVFNNGLINVISTILDKGEITTPHW
ncbi:hypothetical protein SAMN02910436_00558 [Ruminococcaceae bacterium P7]|nr:hypothetical protein SAMN02910436_00558 [Ruminococcaceae bacterium P7]